MSLRGQKQPGKHELLERRTKVAAMYSAGRYQSEIAKKLKVSLSTVERDLRIIRQQWLDSSIRDFDEVRAEQLAKLDEAERSAWEQWERSCRLFKKTVTEDKQATQFPGTNIREEKTPQCGDPRYLSVVLSVIERRCKLLGLDAPEKKEHSSPGGGPVQVQVEDISDEKLHEELERLGLKPKKRQLDSCE